MSYVTSSIVPAIPGSTLIVHILTSVNTPMSGNTMFSQDVETMRLNGTTDVLCVFVLERKLQKALDELRSECSAPSQFQQLIQILGCSQYAKF